MLKGVCVWQRGGGHAWQGACVAKRGMCGVGGIAWQGACMVGCVCGRGACVVGFGVVGSCVAVGGGTCVAGETATAVDGTQPTGTHPCLLEILTN